MNRWEIPAAHECRYSGCADDKVYVQVTEKPHGVHTWSYDETGRHVTRPTQTSITLRLVSVSKHPNIFWSVILLFEYVTRNIILPQPPIKNQHSFKRAPCFRHVYLDHTLRMFCRRSPGIVIIRRGCPSFCFINAKTPPTLSLVWLHQRS